MSSQSLAKASRARLKLRPVELPAEQNPWVVYMASQARGSRPTYLVGARVVLRDFFGVDCSPGAFPWHQLEPAHTELLRQWLVERYSPATARVRLAMVRGVLKQCYRLGLLDRERFGRLTDWAPVRGSRPLPGRALSYHELRALFGQCDRMTPLGARDAALLALGYSCGLRKSELCRLELCDVDLAGRLTVAGKGNVVRELPLPTAAVLAVASWLEHRGTEPGPLFWSSSGRGRGLDVQRLDVGSVRGILLRLAQRAKVAPFTPHDLRRSFASALLDTGSDLATVAKLCGHASVDTTQRYDRRDERAMAAAVARLAVPLDG